jgi:hypothetical protein
MMFCCAGAYAGINTQLHPSQDSLQAASPAAAAAAPSGLSARNSGRSRSRMLSYFRGAQGLAAAGAGCFKGLRVRMGVVTGVVEGPGEAGAALANIMNSSLYKLALGRCSALPFLLLLLLLLPYIACV